MLRSYNVMQPTGPQDSPAEPAPSARFDLQGLIREYRQKWQAKGQWKDPDLADCLDFMITEVAEAIDIRLRLQPIGYVRNNPEQTAPDRYDMAIEVFDAIMMGCIALDLLGVDLEMVARDKLYSMDRKRQEPSGE